MKIKQYFLILLPLLWGNNIAAQSSQINIPRIEQMPNQPTPYNIRDWSAVAGKYDSLVFDLQLTGQYLPLCFLNPSGVNYPQRPSFRMHTYVGTNSPFGNEAINVLPTLVGSTLIGIDKSSQFGQNWVLMAQDFFNKANGENIYLNNAGARSGNDWWYDMMPNVFFYQLYDLYPNMGGESDLQFNSVADRMLEAVRHMGGSDAPWSPAYMNYRAWNFSEMEPNDMGVPEPEAAGAFAWLLYHAYRNTGNETYLKGAEWSIEFLDDWTSNPSYELQLPYGTYTAAKMNAELGTDYDVEKMVNWSFDRGALRGWGTIVGKWGGFEVSGLVGEANDGGNDYAFQLNGMQQAAALVPMVRYDKRFARAIGKWVLNLANASRLFYHGFLPASLQDASGWSEVNDPDQVLGYEALREVWQGNSPYSTGDAVRGGWAATNLALYGTSSVGYLGAMVEQTNIDKILLIDLLKTDFFREEAYPSFLLYNSYSTNQTVDFDAGTNMVDIYDALTETFIAQNVSGTIGITLPADQAALLVVCPAGGQITYDKNKMLVDDIVVDYDQNAQAYTVSPRFKALATAQQPLETEATTTIYATVTDTDSDQLTYQWNVSVGTLSGSGDSVSYTAPPTVQTASIQCIVSDPEGNRDTAILDLSIVEVINQPPLIQELSASSPFTETGGMLQLTCIAIDDLTTDLNYEWTASGGSITGTGNQANWTAPGTEGIYELSVRVSDDNNLSASASISVLVKNFSTVSGQLIAVYPFKGNADDVSGNEQHGQSNGAILTVDRLGNQQQAYYFNGGAQHIEVPNSGILNFTDGITVSCWFKANALPDRESFLISHGSWQNRWKLSITPDRRLRWTVNTNSGIRDLDSSMPLELDSFYHVSATFDGQLLALYIQGELQNFLNFGGTLRTTTFPLLFGQMLPGEITYNFKGVIDEVQINDYPFTPSEVEDLYTQGLTNLTGPSSINPSNLQVYPNPVTDELIIQLSTPGDQIQAVQIYSLTGKLVYSQSSIQREPISINTHQLPSGMYVLMVQGETHTYTDRFIKF